MILVVLVEKEKTTLCKMTNALRNNENSRRKKNLQRWLKNTE
jgi:hypothetical protein